MMIIRMRIAAIDVDLIPLPAVSPPYAWRRGLRGSHPARTTAVLRITTEDGAVGEAYHEWSGPMLGDIVDRILREELVGQRADRREWLWHRLWELDRTEEFPIWVFGIVDVALWDMEGRLFGVPVHRLLGTYRDSIPAYASTTTFPTVEEFLAVCDQCLELGYSALTLHAWGSAPRCTGLPSRPCISAWPFRIAPTTSRSSPRTLRRGSHASVRTVTCVHRPDQASRCRTSCTSSAQARSADRRFHDKEEGREM